MSRAAGTHAAASLADALGSAAATLRGAGCLIDARAIIDASSTLHHATANVRLCSAGGRRRLCVTRARGYTSSPSVSVDAGVTLVCAACARHVQE